MGSIVIFALLTVMSSAIENFFSEILFLVMSVSAIVGFA
jgi:hypothetical protein